ncbi:MAG: MarR family transcriptional regulator [Pseudomonadota bacterium]
MSKRFTDTYLLSLMAQASAAISAEFHDWLASEGVSVADWRILASLYPDIGLTIGELCASCLTKQPTMTRMVDRLVAQELAIRSADRTDRRRVEVRLTPYGQGRAERLINEAKAHEARLLAGYKPEDAAALKALLRIIKDRAAMPSVSAS